MEGTNVKTIAYVLIVLFVVAIFGIAVVKMNTAAQEPPDTRTPEQRLNGLESSPGVTSPQAKTFMHNERERRDATKDAEDAVANQ